MRKFKTGMLLLGLGLFLALQTGCSGKLKPAQGPSDRMAGADRNTLTWATERINSRCPELVDPETRLDSVLLSPDSELYYFFTLIDRERINIDPDVFQAYLWPLVNENIHYNPELKMHRDSSVTIVFNYRDRNGELITEFSVSPENYQ